MKKIIPILLSTIAIMSCGHSSKKAVSVKEQPWQEISPAEIELNPLQMIDKDWLEVSAGKEGDMNLMTILGDHIPGPAYVFSLAFGSFCRIRYNCTDKLIML